MAIPSDISGLQLWVKSDTGITKDGSDLVSQWDDQSGNSRNLTEATNKPLWVNSLVNGYPGIRFDGSNDQLLSPSFSVSPPVTYFLVMKSVSWTAGDRIFTGSDSVGSPEIAQRGTNALTLTDQGIADGPAVTFASGSFGLVKAIANGTSSVMALNNGSDQTSATNLSNGLGRFILGRAGGGGSFGNFEVAEIAIYNSVISGSNLTDLKDYFGPRYNLGFGTAPGQPAVKRMGGVPFASPNRGVW